MRESSNTFVTCVESHLDEVPTWVITGQENTDQQKLDLVQVFECPLLPDINQDILYVEI